MTKDAMHLWLKRGVKLIKYAYQAVYYLLLGWMYDKTFVSNYIAPLAAVNTKYTVSLGRRFVLRPHAFISGVFQCGDDVRIGRGCNFFGYITIGSQVIFAPNVAIAAGNHGYKSGTPIMCQRGTRKPVEIGSDVWVGANAVILGGVTIGDGAVIGAGAVVTKSIPPGAIAVGNPAKVISFRT